MYIPQFSFISMFFLLAGASWAQPSVVWAKAFGGTKYEEAHDVLHTLDGNYFVVGQSSSYDGDSFGNHGQSDFFAIKLNANGGIIWKKMLGGGAQDVGYATKQTSDGGYILAGSADSNTGNVSGNHGGYDAWLVKLDQNGTIQWQHCYGGTKWEEAYAIQATKDGGYVFVGYSESADGDATMNHGFYDAWIVKTDATGNVAWQRSYGGSSDDRALNILPLEDGGYMVLGATASFDGNVLMNHGGFDFWLLRLNFDGKILWQKSYGGGSIDIGSGLLPSGDGGYYLSGQTFSLDGQVSDIHGQSDIWMLKVDSLGEIQWNKCYGGSSIDNPGEMIYAKDSTLMLCGSAGSTDGDVIGNDGAYDFWIVNVDREGNILWQKTFGGTGPDSGYAICQAEDNSFIAVGNAYSHDGDVSGVHGDDADYWVIKLQPKSNITHSPHPAPLQISPKPATGAVQVSISGESIDYQIEISDATGRILHQKSIFKATGRMTLDVSTLPPGWYFLKMTDAEGEVFVGRFLKA